MERWVLIGACVGALHITEILQEFTEKKRSQLQEACRWPMSTQGVHMTPCNVVLHTRIDKTLQKLKRVPG